MPRPAGTKVSFGVRQVDPNQEGGCMAMRHASCPSPGPITEFQVGTMVLRLCEHHLQDLVDALRRGTRHLPHLMFSGPLPEDGPRPAMPPIPKPQPMPEAAPVRDIVNTYMQMEKAGGDRIAFTYQPQGDGRIIQVAGWHVYRTINGREVKTDAQAAWYDRGRKFFSTSLAKAEGTPHARRLKALAEATAWVRRTFPQFADAVFVPNAVGDYVEEAVQEAHPIKRGPRRTAVRA